MTGYTKGNNIWEAAERQRARGMRRSNQRGGGRKVGGGSAETEGVGGGSVC